MGHTPDMPLRVLEHHGAVDVADILLEGVEIEVAYDRSSLIERAVETLEEKLLEESIVVAVVCISVAAIGVNLTDRRGSEIAPPPSG